MSAFKWFLAFFLVIVLLWVLTGLHGVDWLIVKTMPGIKERAQRQAEMKREKSQLVAELDELRKKNSDLIHQNSSLEEEIKHIKSGIQLQNNWTGKGGIQSIDSRVILKDPYNLYPTILIDAGSSKGVKKNMLVVGEDAVVGRVIQVYPSFSRVRTIESPKLALGAIIRRTRELGVVVGGRQGLTLRYLSINSDVRVGDDIITSGTTDITPAGLYIGKVTEVIKREKDEELEARIELPKDIQKLEVVRVITSTREMPEGASLDGGDDS